ncbi:MAG: peptidoglycan-associated lipoprotein Pal [Halobacteriovoraceae bacterium]|nr:peptidoglycan-associated lipoprotein Pal [Halobacteriovoraceae bacterium]
MVFSPKKLALPIALLISIVLTGCGSSEKKTGGSDEVTGVDNAQQAMDFEVSGDSDTGKAGSLQSVYFAFDSAVLTDSTKSSLKANAEFMNNYSSVEVQIEGHCDERGSVQYNLALGEKRAKAVQDYLTSLGVASKRTSIISFGKERPVAFGHQEDSWSKNRRANFVITAK